MSLWSVGPWSMMTLMVLLLSFHVYGMHYAMLPQHHTASDLLVR